MHWRGCWSSGLRLSAGLMESSVSARVAEEPLGCLSISSEIQAPRLLSANMKSNGLHVLFPNCYEATYVVSALY